LFKGCLVGNSIYGTFLAFVDLCHLLFHKQ